MKDRFVGSLFGRYALAAREWLDLRSVSFANPEQAGMIANDILADRLIVRLCADGGAFLDVGAHIGSVFSAAAHYGRNITVYAVEADPDKVQALERRFPYAEIFNCAVGEKEQMATFHRDTGQSGYSSLVTLQGDAIEAFDVPVRRLDDLLPARNVDVMKLDIEGAELGALRGAEGLIRRAQPTIMFESSGTEENSLGYAPQGLWTFFDQLDYDVLPPDRVAHLGAGMSLDIFLDAHIYPTRAHNYFAVARSRRTEIRDRARAILGVKT